MNRNYLRGYRFEIRVLKSLEKLGYSVIRSGKSKFPDSFASKIGHLFWIECKTRKKMPNNVEKLLSAEEYSKAIGMIKDTDIPFYLFYRIGKRIRIYPIGGVDVMNAIELEKMLNGTNGRDSG